MTAQNVEALPLYVPVARVVDRIVNETLDAVEASTSDKTSSIEDWRDAAAKLINEHPSKIELVSWLALQGIEAALSMEASDRGINDYSTEIGSPMIAGTDADVKHSQAMDEEYAEMRRASRERKAAT